MTDRLRGVEQVGQPDVPTPIPIDDARPVAGLAAAERLVIECAVAWDTYRGDFMHGEAAERDVRELRDKLREIASLAAEVSGG